MPFPKVCITCAKPSANHLRLLWKKSAIESVCMDLLKALDIDSSKLEGIKSKLYICDACVRLTEYIKVVSETCQANITNLLEYEEYEKSRLEEMPIHSTSPNEMMKSRFEQMPIHSAQPNETAKSKFEQTPIHSASPNETAKSRLKQTPIHSSSPNETGKSRFKQMPIHSSSPNETAKSKFKQPPIYSASPNEVVKSRLKQKLNHSVSPNGTAKSRFKQVHIHSASPNDIAKKNSGFKRKETNIPRNKTEKPKLSLKFLQKVPRRSTDQSVGIPLNEIRDADLDVEIRSWDHTYATRSVETDTGPGDDHIDYCCRDRAPVFTDNSIPKS